MPIPINKPLLGSEEIQAAASVLKDRNLTSASSAGGMHVRLLEKTISSYLKARHVVAVNSGTAALQASLLALGIKRGDEVLIPSFTFIATANAVTSTGARPTFVDIRKDDYTMDPDDLAKKINGKTRAIIPVHLYGNVAAIDQISEIAKEYNLPVIEDSAQSLGSTFRRKHTGTFFDMGCFSLYPSKVATAGEGGFVATNNKTLHDKLLAIRNHGLAQDGTPETFGLNLRLPEISAAIACIQMKKLPRFLKTRERNADHITKLISDLDIQLPYMRNHVKTNWYLYTVAISDRNKVMKKLNRNGIGATPYYSLPIHRTKFYKKRIRLPVTDWASEHVLSLPIHPDVTTHDIEFIAKIMRSMI